MTTPPPGGLPASVVLGPGEGGLDRLVVAAPGGSAEVYLHGAHVTRWQPSGETDVLWLSPSSRFTPGAAIRGGVPICFPWFGAHATDPSALAHGFARVLPWRLVAAREAGDDVVVELELTDSAETRGSAWPHRFRIAYRVTVGSTLRLDLEVTNTGDAPVTVGEALHTYLAVGDVRQVSVHGLEGTAYVDKVAAGRRRPGDAGPLRLTGETDRIYLATDSAVTVEDPAGGRRLLVGKDGSATTVLWNPWATKAAAMADVGEGRWTGFVCVETSNVADHEVTVEPGATHRMTATLAVEREP